MIRTKLSIAARALRAQFLGEDVEFNGVCTDTRKLQPGNLFIALKGEKVDGHDFLEQARKAGAAAALVSSQVKSKLPQLICGNSEQGLGRLAAWYRTSLRARVAAITGSNGKTTIKALVAQIMQSVGRTVVTTGNLNNEIGLPLTLLGVPANTEFLILEMGAGKPGDIDYLARIGRPHVALVNNVASAHLERMGSIKGVAETKGAIYSNLSDDGIAVINSDEPFASYFLQRAGQRRNLKYGLGGAAQISAEIKSLGFESEFDLVTPVGRAEIKLALAGKHNVVNALAAASVAMALGASLSAIRNGLNQKFKIDGRLTRHQLLGGAELIDDSYNANPGSMNAAIRTLALFEGKRILVLGDMRELGVGGADLTREVGALAKREGITQLFTVGELSRHAVTGFGENGIHFESQESLIQALLPQLLSGVAVLIKGSRGATMEHVVHAIIKKLGTTNTAGAPHAA